MKDRKENGITLVALVVTIIVLIILAGISISAITGENGLISKSKIARDEALGMQNETAKNREDLYGEIVDEKYPYKESGDVGIELVLAEASETSITAIANVTETNSEIVSYTFYIKKVTENDSAYVTIKKENKLDNTVTCTNLEKDVGYKIKVVAMDKEGVSKTAERKIALGNVIKISVTPLSGPDSYPSTVSVTATSSMDNMDYIVLPNGEKVYAKNGKLNIKTTYNSTKNGPITFTAYDKGDNVSSLKYDEQNVINFETEWTITEANTEVTVPVFGPVDLYIDYGDETKENVTTEKPTHTYTTPGTYTMKISGKCSEYRVKEESRDYLTGVNKWGVLSNNYYAFEECINLKGTIPVPHEKSFVNITSFDKSFSGCSGITGNIPIGIFDNCTKVKSFYRTFRSCGGLTGNIPDRLFANKTEVVTFSYCFEGCSGLTGEIPEDLFVNCPSVKEMEWTFSNCQSLTKIPSLLFTNVNNGENNNITKMNATFKNMTGIKEIPEGLFDKCTEVTVFGNNWAAGGIFRECKNLEIIPNGLFKNCTKVDDIGNAFKDCISLTSLPKDFIIPNSVTRMEYTFGGCSNLKTLSDNFLFPDNAVTIAGAFYGCKSLLSLPDNIIIPNNVTNMYMTFNYCHNLAALPDNFTIPDSVTSMNYTFNECRSIKKLPANFKIGNNVKEIHSAFGSCTSLEYLSDNFTIPNSVKNMSSIFWGDSNLKRLPENFRIGNNVTSISAAFWNCYNLENLPNNFTIPESVEFASGDYGTFSLCHKLKGTMTIRANLTEYKNFLSGDTAKKSGGTITVNYTANCVNIDEIIATGNPEYIKKGVLVE